MPRPSVCSAFGFLLASQMTFLDLVFAVGTQDFPQPSRVDQNATQMRATNHVWSASPWPVGAGRKLAESVGMTRKICATKSSYDIRRCRIT